MDEPPASWDQQEEENPSISSTTTKFVGLNINATEFVPSFGSGFSSGSKAPSASTPPIPKTPPSTPVIVRHTNENEANQTEKLFLNKNQIELNDQQQMEEDLPTKEENEFLDDDNEGEILNYLLSFLNELIKIFRNDG
jgi:hypothetical protein